MEDKRGSPVLNRGTRCREDYKVCLTFSRV